MNSLRFFSTSSKSLIPDIQNNKLDALVEWCRIVHGCLDAGQVEDAKIFLEQAISEAEKPIEKPRKD